MAATTDDAAEAPPRSRKKLILISLALAAAGAGGGWFAASSGLLPFGTSDEETSAKPEERGTVFVPVDPILISLGSTGSNRHLSFRAQLEVPAAAAPEVAGLMPRIVDVLNSYLRAVDVREFDSPHGLIRLRAQMLRRVQIIVGDAKVNDLLVMEFVLN
jgi:flagellar FliL protein